MSDSNEPTRNAQRGGDDELSGMVFMSGDQVAWAGPDAVLGQSLQEDEAGLGGEDGEESVATGEDYTPPDDEPSGE